MCLIETALSITNSVYASEARSNQAELAKQNARLQREQVYDQFNQEVEAGAQKAYELSRQALVARGVARASNLGDRSVRAIGRAIGFNLGQDKAIIARNAEIAAKTAAAKLRGIDISLASQKLQIGPTNATALGLEIFSTITTNADIGGRAFGLNNAQSMFGGTAGTTTVGGLSQASAIDAAAGGAAATGGPAAAGAGAQGGAGLAGLVIA